MQKVCFQVLIFSICNSFLVHIPNAIFNVTFLALLLNQCRFEIFGSCKFIQAKYLQMESPFNEETVLQMIFLLFYFLKVSSFYRENKLKQDLTLLAREDK